MAEKIRQEPGSRNFWNSNIDEVDGIYLATSNAFFIMGRDPGHGGGGEGGGVTQPNCLEASQIGTPGQKKIDIGTLGQKWAKIA